LLGVFEGRCSGLIATKERGKSGFGYDPIFLIPKYFGLNMRDFSISTNLMR